MIVISLVFKVMISSKASGIAIWSLFPSVMRAAALSLGPTMGTTCVALRFQFLWALIHNIFMRSARQFPTIDSSARIWYLNIVERLFECLLCISLLIALVDGTEAFGEGILIDVELVVKLWVWIASKSFICELIDVDDGRAISIISH